MEQRLKFGLGDLTGAFGDIGTFAPIYLSLVALCGLAPGRSLALVGLVYIVAALYFRLPVPVQPLKAMAAICIARHLPPSTLAAAGLWMGVLLTGLAASGKVEWLNRFFTRTIVKGIQLGVGLILVKSGLTLLFQNSGAAPAPIATAAFSFPTVSDFKDALVLLVIPQIPLTLGNAVYAICDVAHDYFGAQAKRAAPRNMALSLGLTNLVIGAAGGLPVCHGSGGMTAHYGFGARSAGSTLIIGTLFVVVGLALPGTAHELIARIPKPLLGALLVYPGACHVLLIRKLEKRVPLAVAMGVLGAATGNLAYALALGLAGQAALDRRLIPA